MKNLFYCTMAVLVILASACSSKNFRTSELLFHFEEEKMESIAFRKLFSIYGGKILESKRAEITYPGQKSDYKLKEESLDRILFVFVRPFDLKASIDTTGQITLKYMHDNYFIALDPYGKVLHHETRPPSSKIHSISDVSGIPQYLKETPVIRKILMRYKKKSGSE